VGDRQQQPAIHADGWQRLRIRTFAPRQLGQLALGGRQLGIGLDRVDLELIE